MDEKDLNTAINDEPLEEEPKQNIKKNYPSSKKKIISFTLLFIFLLIIITLLILAIISPD
jgi:hypothetical protein